MASDIATAYAEATRIADRVADLADIADQMTDSAAYAVTDARLALEGGGDFDAILGALEAAREALKDAHKLAGELLHGLDTLDTEDLVCRLDDLQHDADAREDFATMALDVERGIRDPAELRALIHSMTPNYVL